MSAPAENVDLKVEDIAPIVETKKPSWMGTLFKQLSYIFVFWVFLLAIQIAFSVQATWTQNSKKNSENESLSVNDLKRPAIDAVVFLPDDVSSFVPSTGAVQQVRSDRTTQDLLNGKWGPVIVLFTADWCPQCRNMMPAFEEAATKAKIPFVRVDGDNTVQTQKHFKVGGFPTMYGVDADNRVWPFDSHRTVDEILKFANKMTPVKVEVLDEDLKAEVPKESEIVQEESKDDENVPNETESKDVSEQSSE